MYRARAEAVSGTQVYAGGKWLQCIGNKNVSVGDYIWTDGRCVYGNHYTPQQPLIITAPEGEIIPIIMFDSDAELGDEFNAYSYYVYKSKIKPCGEPYTDKQSDRYDFAINDEKKIYLGSENKIGVRWWYRDLPLTASAVNIEGKNFYKLRCSRERGGMVAYPPYIYVYKNGELIDKIDLREKISELSDLKSYGAENLGTFACPFIKDENNWRVIIKFYERDSDTRTETIPYTTTIYHNELAAEAGGWHISPYTEIKNHTATLHEYTTDYTYHMYLVTMSAGKLETTEICSGNATTKSYDNYAVEYELIQKWKDFVSYYEVISGEILSLGKTSFNASTEHKTINQKILLHDGFYFIINDYLDPPSNVCAYPLFWNISIYSRSDVLITTNTFAINSNIAICKAGSAHLIAVNNTYKFKVLDSYREEYQKENMLTDFRKIPEIIVGDPTQWLNPDETGYDLEYERDYFAYFLDSDYVHDGLYLCKDKEFTKIADGACLNQRFRPMENIGYWKNKNWQGKIKEITFTE